MGHVGRAKRHHARRREGAMTARINLAADPALPQRDLLLDVEEVGRRLSARLGSARTIEIDSCERLRTKYSPGASLRVLHRIQVAGVSYTVAARAFTGGR